MVTKAKTVLRSINRKKFNMNVKLFARNFYQDDATESRRLEGGLRQEWGLELVRAGDRLSPYISRQMLPGLADCLR